MLTTAAFAETAALIGEPSRAAMLLGLMDGRALTATELAKFAGITPQTASEHLARLTACGLLAIQRQGRHRYHRLASPTVAQMLEAIMEVASGARQLRPTPRLGPADARLRAARSCYDHLAGRLGVALADALVAGQQIELGADAGAVTPAGAALFARLGVVAKPREGRLFCRPCLDWSERRPHLAGGLGAALCSRCFDLGWIKRLPGTRAVMVTREGKRGFAEAFGISAL